VKSFVYHSRRQSLLFLLGRPLACAFLLGLSLQAVAQETRPGNPQLTVIPRGGSKPVPYEAVRAWETGKYLNFYRLPNVGGTVEPRSRFNRNYGVHALEWLSDIERLSKVLHGDLLRAAKTTTFRIVNDYITWKHEPYPDGEIDYKKYEKAAFYNGEIILSTPVMDRVGPLVSDQAIALLTAEQNQGFVVIHELINAAYPDLPVASKLKIGEALIRSKIFHESAVDFAYQLGSIDLRFIRLLKSREEFTNLMEELIRYAGGGTQAMLQGLKDSGVRYAYTDRPLPRVFEEEARALAFAAGTKNGEKLRAIQELLARRHQYLQILGYEFRGPMIDLEALKVLARTHGIPLGLLANGIKDPVTRTTLGEQAMSDLGAEWGREFFSRFDGYLEGKARVNPESFNNDLLSAYPWRIREGAARETEETVKWIKDWLSHMKPALIEGFPVDEWAKAVLNSNPEGIQARVLSGIREHLARAGFRVNEEKTRRYFEWLRQIKSGTTLGAEFPFHDGDSFMRLEALYKVVRVNRDREEFTCVRSGERRIFGREERGGHNGVRQVYSISSNLEMILFLD
jgi:hypothetical protein